MAKVYQRQRTEPAHNRTLIIDSHTHILPDDFRSEKKRWLDADRTFAALFGDTAATTASAAELIAEMDRSGVDVSVALGYGWTDLDAASLSNDYLLAAGSEYPNRVIPFCSVDPGRGESAVREVERCLSLGARGIGELHSDTQDWNPEQGDDLRPIMELAEEAAVPVVVHASEPLGHRYPGKGTATPDRLIHLSESFPGVAFVFSHFGGGMPYYSLMPEVAEALSNSYFDSAASPFLYRSSVYGVSAAAAGSDRILFGSDYPLISQRRALREARNSGLDRFEEAGILGENARDLFGITSR